MSEKKSKGFFGSLFNKQNKQEKKMKGMIKNILSKEIELEKLKGELIKMGKLEINKEGKLVESKDNVTTKEQSVQDPVAVPEVPPMEFVNPEPVQEVESPQPISQGPASTVQGIPNVPPIMRQDVPQFQQPIQEPIQQPIQEPIQQPIQQPVQEQMIPIKLQLVDGQEIGLETTAHDFQNLLNEIIVAIDEQRSFSAGNFIINGRHIISVVY